MVRSISEVYKDDFGPDDEYESIPEKTKLEIDVEVIQKETRNIALLSAYLYITDYQYVMNLIEKYYDDKDVWIRSNCIDNLALVFGRFQKISGPVVLKVLQKAFYDTDRQIQSSLESAIDEFQEKAHEFDFSKIKEKWEISDTVMPKPFHEKLVITHRFEEKDFCCRQMWEGVVSESIQYDPSFRDYSISLSENSASLLRYCPWCSTLLPSPLNKEIFQVLEEELGIRVPDFETYKNIPEEFKSDAWWKKRGL